MRTFTGAVTEATYGLYDFNMHGINVALVNVVKELKAENDSLGSGQKNLNSV